MKNIMIQGTMSGAGKSLLVAGLCRIFKEDGYSPAPFKSQNMALNSYITKDGLEMGRAQVTQAEAAGLEPSALMNPILLKPTTDTGSQVIVNGRVRDNMSARDYFAYKKALIPEVMEAYGRLAEMYSPIVIEGAGSPAEINLRKNDIVNMGLAEMVDAPVLLVGDIDRGGVFAQLLGTVEWLSKEERARVKGFIINKFRGDVSLLDDGLRMLEERTGIPVLGVVPYVQLDLPDEDSLTERFASKKSEIIDIVVVRLPHISNFSDFDVFEGIEGVSLRYASRTDELRNPDMMIIPGTKNTIDDLRWLRESGMETAVLHYAEKGIVFGICGGYQMLGKNVADPDSVECGGEMRGMGLLNIDTVLTKEKKRTQVKDRFTGITGALSALEGMEYEGYEIHMGRSSTDFASNGNIYGSYVHGIFDAPGVAGTIIKVLLQRRGLDAGSLKVMSEKERRENSYKILANVLRKSLNLDKIYEIISL